MSEFQAHIHLSQTDSTNNFLKNLHRDLCLENFTFVTADFQTSGKGQHSKSWHSEANSNLLFSILILHKLEIDELFYLSKFSALIVKLLCMRYAENVEIKWPNDIFVNKQKIAGILIENSISHTSVKFSIVGIGLNVNQIQFPDSLKNAVSLSQITNQAFDNEQLADDVVLLFKTYFYLIESKQFATIDELYHEHLFQKNVIATYKIGQNQIVGQIKHVCANGQLLIETETEDIIALSSGEVEFSQK